MHGDDFIRNKELIDDDDEKDIFWKLRTVAIEPGENWRCKVMQDCWEERLTKDSIFCSGRQGKGRCRKEK